jgi:hypothetical protein
MTGMSVQSKPEVGGRNREVRFTPESRLNSDIAACPEGAMCGHRRTSVDHLVGVDQQRIRNGEAERIRWLAIDDEFSAGHSGQLSPMVISIREHRRNAAGLASGSRANSRQF